MEIINLKEYDNVIVSGDIHGNFETLAYKVCLQHQITDSIIIVAGDCGFGFEKPEYYKQIYSKINKKISKYNNIFIFVRGNHDDPSYFNNKLINHHNFFTVKDYSVIQTRTKNILCVGGATSIDRIIRIDKQNMRFAKSKFYWYDEQPVFDKEKVLELTNNGIFIDTVITHTSPSFCQKLTKEGIREYIEYDPNLRVDCDNERKTMDLLYESLKENNHVIKDWVYGHFHMSHRDRINDINFSLLDILELKQL